MKTILLFKKTNTLSYLLFFCLLILPNFSLANTIICNSQTGNWNNPNTWASTSFGSSTISVSNGSTIVNGSGTSFMTDLAVGSKIAFVGTVASISSNTQLTLVSPATSAYSGTWQAQIVPRAVDDVEILNGAKVTVNTPMAFCTNLYLGEPNFNFEEGTYHDTIAFDSGSQLFVSGNVNIGSVIASYTKYGHIIMTNGGTLQVGGNMNLIQLGSFVAGTGTIQYNGANATILDFGTSSPYKNLTLGGTGTYVAANARVNGRTKNCKYITI